MTRFSVAKANLLALFAIFFCASALAQVRFCIGGDLDHLTSAQRNACNARMQAVRSTAATLNVPENWHFVVVCGEQGWKEYTAYAAAAPEALSGTVASTDFEQHETFLREQMLNLNDRQELRRVLSSELARIAAGPAGQQTAANLGVARTSQVALSTGGL